MDWGGFFCSGITTLDEINECVQNLAILTASNFPDQRAQDSFVYFSERSTSSVTHALSRMSPWAPVSMVTTLGSLPGGQSGAYVYVRGGEGGRVQNPHVWVICIFMCVRMPASISVGLLSSLNIQISESQTSLHICTAPPLLTSFWWRTSYSVLCLSSVSIRISGIASIFIPVTGEGRKSTIYYRWWH